MKLSAQKGVKFAGCKLLILVAAFSEITAAHNRTVLSGADVNGATDRTQAIAPKIPSLPFYLSFRLSVLRTLL
jgi:hypothetical protein